MSRIKPDRRALIRWKIYIDRAKMYVSYIQFLMIGLVFLETYKDSKFGAFIFEYALISIPILLMIFIAFSLLLGRLDTVLGLREEELRNSSSSNPVMREILNTLEELKMDIKDLKSEKK